MKSVLLVLFGTTMLACTSTVMPSVATECNTPECARERVLRDPKVAKAYEDARIEKEKREREVAARDERWRQEENAKREREATLAAERAARAEQERLRHDAQVWNDQERQRKQTICQAYRDKHNCHQVYYNCKPVKTCRAQRWSDGLVHVTCHVDNEGDCDARWSCPNEPVECH